MNLKRRIGLDILAEKYAYASDPDAGYTSAQKDSRPLGRDHVRLLLGGLRDVRRSQRRPRRQRPRKSRPSRKPREAVPQGAFGAPHARGFQSREVSAATQERQAGARGLGRSSGHDGREVPCNPGALRPKLSRCDQHRTTCYRGVLHTRKAGATRFRHQEL